MKSKHRAFLLLAFLVAAGSALAASQISVSGVAEIRVAPDEINLRVGVETRNPKLAAATESNNAAVASAIAFLRESGIDAKDIQTDFLSVSPLYEHGSDDVPHLYEVRKSLEIRVRKVETLENILTGLLSHGVNYIHGVEFRTTQLRKYRDEARAAALRAAKEKAAALAKEMGLSLGRVVNLNASDFGGWYGAQQGFWSRGGGGMVQNSVQNAGGPSDGDGDTLSMGQISVSASVNVSFELP